MRRIAGAATRTHAEKKERKASSPVEIDTRSYALSPTFTGKVIKLLKSVNKPKFVSQTSSQVLYRESFLHQRTNSFSISVYQRLVSHYNDILTKTDAWFSPKLNLSVT